MNLRSVFPVLLACVLLPSASLAASPGTPSAISTETATGATAAVELTAQDTLAAALRWLNERYPLETLLEDDPEFFYEATDVVLDDVSGLLLVAYRSDQDATSAWLAWLGLDEDLVVVLIEGVTLD